MICSHAHGGGSISSLRGLTAFLSGSRKRITAGGLYPTSAKDSQTHVLSHWHPVSCARKKLAAVGFVEPFRCGRLHARTGDFSSSFYLVLPVGQSAVSTLALACDRSRLLSAITPHRPLTARCLAPQNPFCPKINARSVASRRHATGTVFAFQLQMV